MVSKEDDKPQNIDDGSLDDAKGGSKGSNPQSRIPVDPSDPEQVVVWCREFPPLKK